MRFRNNKGFTLIELLVVIAIIGLLSSTVLASLSSARIKSRDARRKSDMMQMRLSLELYYEDNRAYPSTSGAWYGVSNNGGNRGTTGAGGYIPNLAPAYIPTLPTDPVPDVSGWSGYLYRSDGSNFKLLSHANGPESFPSSSSDPFYDPVRPTWAWRLCSGPPACDSW